MNLHTLALASLCSTCLLLAAPAVLAAPNGHANEHASDHGQDGGQSSGDHGNPHSGGGGESADTETPSHSTVRKYVVANGLKQGEVAPLLKSWNALNANPKAFANMLDNPDSLLGKQARYICADAQTDVALTAYTDLGGSRTNPPSAEDVAAATAYLNAEAIIGATQLDTIPDVADATYSQELVDAAKLAKSSQLTSSEAMQTLKLAAAWQTYQNAVAAATSSFAAASVSYKDGQDLAQLRQAVDGVIAQKGLDLESICTTTVASTD